MRKLKTAFFSIMLLWLLLWWWERTIPTRFMFSASMELIGVTIACLLMARIYFARAYAYRPERRISQPSQTRRPIRRPAADYPPAPAPAAPQLQPKMLSQPTEVPGSIVIRPRRRFDVVRDDMEPQTETSQYATYGNEDLLS